MRTLAFLFCTVTASALWLVTTGSGQASSPAVSISDFTSVITRDLDNSTNRVFEFDASLGDQPKIVRGRLLSADGTPIAGAKIVFSRGREYFFELHQSNLAVSDESGRFTVRGAVEMNVLNVEIGETGWLWKLKPRQTDVEIRWPKLREVELRWNRPIQLRERKFQVVMVAVDDAAPLPIRHFDGQFDDRGVARLVLPVGRGQLFGGKQIGDKDLPNPWGWAALGEIEIASDSSQEVVLQKPTGSRISGHVPGFEALLAQHNATHATVSIMLPVERFGRWKYQQWDSAACDANGDFKLGPVPAGPAELRLSFAGQKGAANPAQPRQFRFSRTIKKRVTLREGLESIDLAPPTLALGPAKAAENRPTLANRIAALLDSEGPINVSWSHSDVVVSQIAGLQPADELSAELVRLMNDPKLPDNWLHDVIAILGVVGAREPGSRRELLRAASNPQLNRRPEMLMAIGKSGAKGIDVLPELQQFLNDEDPMLRSSALRAITQIGQALPQEDPAVTNSVIAALQDESASIRTEAAGYLGRTKVAAGIAPLERALRDSPPSSARATVAWALFHSAGNTNDTVPVLVELLKDPDAKVCLAAALSLSLFDQRAVAALPDLERLAAHNDKPPFSGSAETLRFQLASVARQAIAKIKPAAAQ